MSKYHRTIKGVEIDVYDVLMAWGITNPATQHCMKKLFMPGMRGVKGTIQDMEEALVSLQRAIELEKELLF